MDIIHEILIGVRQQVADAKRIRPSTVLERWLKNAPPVLDFKEAVRGGGIIAEIKVKSPSAGMMNPRLVQESPYAYQESKIVHAVSVLTNKLHFGMIVESIKSVRKVISKPILRKDFIIDEYQVLEARAFGADAILLMAHPDILSPEDFQKLHSFARSLGLHVLCEVRSEDQILTLPKDVEICGINSRNFDGDIRFALSRLTGGDFTTVLGAFNLISKLPRDCVKVAESGINPQNFAKVMEMGFDAALIGTSLLKSPIGIRAELEAFEKVSLQHTGVTRFKREPVSA